MEALKRTNPENPEEVPKKIKVKIKKQNNEVQNPETEVKPLDLKTQKILTQINERRKYYRALADTYFGLQKIRVASNNRIKAMLNELDEIEDIRESVLNSITTELIKLEKAIGDEAKEVLKNEPVYVEFLSKVKGLGPILSLKLLSINWDMTKYLSSWNAYCGMIPYAYKCKCEEGHRILFSFNPFDPQKQHLAKCYYVLDIERDKKKKTTKIIRCKASIISAEKAPCRKYKGYAIFWNPKAKTIMWLIGTSLAKTGGFYKEIYKKWKNFYLTNKKLKTGHAIQCAIRKTSKLFLAHFYQAYHEVEGLECPPPYQFDYLNHDDFIHWTKVIEIDEV